MSHLRAKNIISKLAFLRVFIFLEKKNAFGKKPQKHCVTLDQEDVELKIVQIKTFKTDISKNFNFFLRGSSL